MIKIFTLPEFEKSLKRHIKKYPSLKTEFISFLEKTENEGVQGTPMGKGFYKARISVKSKGKGKRGGFRIISHEIIVSIKESTIRLVSIYNKSEISSIDKKYLESVIRKYISK